MDYYDKLRNVVNSIPLFVYTILIYFTCGIMINPTFKMPFLELLDKVWPSFLSFLFTIIVIERLEKIKEIQEEQKRLLRRVQSKDNRICKVALEELRAMGHMSLSNSILKKKVFKEADWSNAYLANTDLRFSDLSKVTLSNCNLSGANLRGAILIDREKNINKDLRSNFREKLQTLNKLKGCIMPNGKVYNGALNLKGDIRNAQKKGIDVKDDKAMARYYGIAQVYYQDFEYMFK